MWRGHRGYVHPHSSETKTFKSSHWSCSIKTVAPKTFGKFTGRHPCWSLFLIKLQALRTDARLTCTLKILLFFRYNLVKLCSRSYIQKQVEHPRWSFFTSVKPYFKKVLNLIKLPLGSSFYTTHPFVKKTVKTSGEVFC